MRRASWGLVAMALASALGTAGCRSNPGIGAESITEGRADYNTAIQRTDAEQLLLNIVRLRYRDTTYFLEVSAVATSFEASGSAGAAGTFVKGAPNPYDAFVNVRVADKPTVTYAPLKGDKFVKQMMTPISLDTLVLLVRSGWSAERVMGLCVAEMNGLENAPSASGPTPRGEPAFREFAEAVSLMRQLQESGAARFGMGEKDFGESVPLVLRLMLLHLSGDDRDTARLRTLLGVGADARLLDLSDSGRADGEATVAVATRSLMAVLFYLSQNVDAPEDDVEEGRVTVTRAADGSAFDWNQVVGHLFRVHSSSSRPDNAYVAVRHRGCWFWIDDSDLDSKSTFSLLSQILALQSGSVPSTAPVLTLPVGG